MRKYIFWLFILLFSSCSERWKGDVRKLKLEDINEGYNDWELVDYHKKPYGNEGTITKIDGDTIKSLDFIISGSRSEIYEFRKKFPCGEADTCVLYIDPPNDTIYSYKRSNGQNYFYSGEYNYRFINLLFEKDEYDFYLFFEDSLSRVKGNGLPKLPNLSPLQKSKLDSILRRND